MLQEARTILKNAFGYNTFRPLQEDIISHTLSGKDCVVLMPTGGGKSLCFQIPALMREGVTIVVSPLISLMKDQVEALRANGIAAAYYNSSLSVTEEQAVIRAARQAEIKLLYLSPERLLSIADSWLRDVQVSMVAIDEAHCVSMWGHDFRPEYTQLKAFRDKLNQVPFMALTATADKATRKDISNQIGLYNPEVFISSFNRENLSLEVRSNVKKKKKITQIVEYVKSRKNESGIIYCLSRKLTEEIAGDLQNAGINARAYHAGMTTQERSDIQEGFINDTYPVICATIAFGMGIDKSNVRYVIHNNLPKNIESYYQEIGRAGRDGEPSETILYFNLADLVMLNRFIAESGQRELLEEKLKRIQQYAEATTCRRKILLSYFGEHLNDNCGNCDVCQNPPKFFDGSVLAQKALSGLLRTGEQVGTNMLINILRGSQNQDVLEKGYQKLKTHGAGKDVSFNDWQHYLTQMLNLGVMEIEYDNNFALKVTQYGRDILFNGRELHLTHPQVAQQVQEARKQQFAESPEEALFEKLRKLRWKIAKEEDVPAYVIFTDATLREMAHQQPVTELDMLAISGMSKAKYHKYGVSFIMEIEKFQTPKISTYEQTHQLYQQGKSIDEIAAARKLSLETIYSHLAKLYQDGQDIDLRQFITDEELAIITEAHSTIQDTQQLKPYFERFNGEMPYYKIRVGLTVLEKS